MTVNVAQRFANKNILGCPINLYSILKVVDKSGAVVAPNVYSTVLTMNSTSGDITFSNFQ
jgi:hypothetical protein